METTFFRFVNRSGDKEKVFNQAFSFIIILNAILIFAESIANWMMHQEFKQYIIWFAVIIVLDSTSSLFLAKLRYQEKAKRFALIQLSSIGVNIVLNIFFIFISLHCRSVFKSNAFSSPKGGNQEIPTS